VRAEYGKVVDDRKGSINEEDDNDQMKFSLIRGQEDEGLTLSMSAEVVPNDLLL